jgi:hypothetical protein
MPPQQKSLSISTIETLTYEKCDYLSLKDSFDRMMKKDGK